MQYVQLRYALLGVAFFLGSVGYAGWVAYVATTQQVRLAEETQRLLAENAQAATAAAVARQVTPSPTGSPQP